MEQTPGNSNKRVRKDVVSRAQYESTEALRMRQEFLVDVITKLESYIYEQGDNDVTAQESKLRELEEVGKQLEILKITREYLDQFTEPNVFGGKKFTSKGRNDPKLMMDWVTYELVKIIAKLRNAITASQASNQGSEFGDKVDGGMRTYEQDPENQKGKEKLAEFWSTQTLINFLRYYLDAELEQKK